MDLRLLLLSLTTIAGGLAESILIGIPPPLAEDPWSPSAWLASSTTLFSSPVSPSLALLLGWLTRCIERRRLPLATLFCSPFR